MRTIQEIFSMVIENKLYRRHMCIALLAAKAHKVISQYESQMATQAILDYLNGEPILAHALEVRGLPQTPREVYLDWENRPKLEPLSNLVESNC